MADSHDPSRDERESEHLPDLIQEFRAESGRLARLREDLLAAADRESGEIVAAARAEVRRAILKARRELVVLNAQVRATIDMGQSRHDDRRIAGAPELHVPADVLTSARHGAWRVLHEARPDLDALASEAGHLRARPPVAPPHEPVLGQVPAASGGDSRTPATTIRTLLLGVAVILLAAVVGTVLWVRRSSTTEETTRPPTAAPGATTATPPPVNAGETPTRVEPPPQPAALSMTLEATRQVWIRLTVDGSVTAGRLFEPGETQDVTATRDVSIRAGDAGAVLVALDAGPPAALGRDGEVITRRFAVDASSDQGAPVTGTDALRNQLVASAERWLEAYYTQDRRTMAALSSAQATVTDQRAEDERLPAGLPGVRRTVTDPRVQVYGADAVLTARISERVDDPAAGKAAESVSFISQLWTRGTGGWQLMDVRIASAAALNKAFRH
jgi:hypothetical protein